MRNLSKVAAARIETHGRYVGAARGTSEAGNDILPGRHASERKHRISKPTISPGVQKRCCVADVGEFSRKRCVFGPAGET